MVEVLATVLLGLHLLAMNVVSGAPVVAVWLDRKACRGDTSAQSAVRQLLIVCCVCVPLGALLGVALGWLYWNNDYQTTLQKFEYRIRWGIIEYLFSAVIIAAYTVWICWRPKVGKGALVARSLLAILTATNLLYHFPPLFSLIAGVSSGHLEITQSVDSATFRRLLVDGEVLALSTHFLFASFAVTGMLLAVIARKPAMPAETTNRVAVTGGRCALVSTLCQIPVGIWLVAQLPSSEQQRLFGRDFVAAVLFVTAILGTFILLHLLAAISFGDTSRKTVWRATAALVIIVLLMTGTLQREQRHDSSNQAQAARSNKTVWE